MTYKEFLSEIGIESNILWNFCKENSIKDKEINNLLSSIAFSFFSKNNKLKLYQLIKTSNLDDNRAMKIRFLIEDEFSEVFNKYPVRKILIEKFVDSLLDWIEILCDNINTNTIKSILGNIRSNNRYFWFTLAEKLYEKSKHKENLILIENKKQLFKNNYLYEDLILMEIKTIRQLNYLDDKELLEKICKLSKKLESYRYEKIILKLECSLLRNEDFNIIFNNYISEIKLFNINELLNVYELSILSEKDSIIRIVKKLLIQNNIFEYDSLEEYDTFTMLEALNEKKSVFEDKKNIKESTNSYDFKHINWYQNRNK